MRPQVTLHELSAPGLLSSLMSLDFFFVPLATKIGASLDEVKASREEGAQSSGC